MRGRRPARLSMSLSKRSLSTVAVVAAIWAVGASLSWAAAQPPSAPSEYQALTDELAAVIQSGDPARYLDLIAPEADRDLATAFAREHLSPGVTTAVLRPTFRRPLDGVPEGQAYELFLDVFLDLGSMARLETWRLEVIRPVDAADVGTTPWLIADQSVADALDGLHHLTLDSATQYDAAGLRVVGEDMTLSMSEGTAFVARIDTGVTGLVVSGRGIFTFTPEPETERGQLEVFAGSQVLETEFSGAFLRFSPDMFESGATISGLTTRRVDEGDLKRATRVFDEFVGVSYKLDLSHLSDKLWSLVPTTGSWLAEIRTDELGVLTYAQSVGQPEDITLHVRDTARTIALYPSARQRATQERYFAESDGASYDVLDYQVQASFEPAGVLRNSFRARPELEGCWIAGTTRMTVQVTAASVRSLSLRLADELEIESISSPELGPLLFFRFAGQNNVVVGLPSAVERGARVSLDVRFAGLLKAQAPAENWLGSQRLIYYDNTPFPVGERRYLYSSDSYWFPQAAVSDYATATLDLTVPADYGAVASGHPDTTNPPLPAEPGATGQRRFRFETRQPARYLSTLISRFADQSIAETVSLGPDAPALPGTPSGTLHTRVALTVAANARSVTRVAEQRDLGAAILEYYMSLMGDAPYPSLTLALVDSVLPGGHSPAYFATLNHPLPRRRGLLVSWGSDPLSFSDFPSFFLAHELAHQWWGQAVSGNNYHEQWLSEGLSQYFAALYVQREGGDDALVEVLSQMRRWAIQYADAGPIYLGYRLGHIEDESRPFRALVYNKSALVMHMLRRLIGDEAFFGGLRRFYATHRFQRAGTDDLIRAFETESGRSLEGFFERWIHDAALPRIRFAFSTETAGPGETGFGAVVLRFEQVGQPFELPVTVTLRYGSGAPEDVIVPIAGARTELRVPLRGPLQGVDINRDNAALAEFIN
jgi:hypothetical protein